MTDDIELHDSNVEVSASDGSLVLRFRPAYVHHWERTDSGWVGEGRTQAVDLIVVEGIVDSGAIAGPFELSDGEICIDGDLLDNRVPVPLERTGHVRGRLEPVNAGLVTFVGSGLSVRFAGSPTFVELLPAEWTPRDAEEGTTTYHPK